MKTRICSILFIVVITLLNSCTTPTEPVKDGIISGKITLADMGMGVKDIQVILIDRNAKIDTVTYKNEHCFVDTVYTDENGNYTFNNLSHGSYSVFVTSERFTIKSLGTSPTNNIEIKNNTVQTLNFEANLNVQSGTDRLSLKIELVNAGKDAQKLNRLYIERRKWAFFIPYFISTYFEDSQTGKERDYTNTKLSSNGVSASFGVKAGYTLLLTTLDNYWRIKYKTSDGWANDAYVFEISAPLYATGTLEWTIDAVTKEVKLKN